MLKRIGIAFVVTALALGGSLVAGGVAGAADSHTVTVTPSTGLSDGQTVTVSGTGFVETPIVYDWSVSECESAVLSDITLDGALAHCDVTTTPFVFTHADAAGNLSTPYTLRKSFTISSGVGRQVTCGQAPNDCVLLVAQLTDQGFVGAGAPISFGTPTVAQCFRDFARDHQHRLSYRLTHLLACVVRALAHRPS